MTNTNIKGFQGIVNSVSNAFAAETNVIKTSADVAIKAFQEKSPATLIDAPLAFTVGTITTAANLISGINHAIEDSVVDLVTNKLPEVKIPMLPGKEKPVDVKWEMVKNKAGQLRVRFTANSQIVIVGYASDGKFMSNYNGETIATTPKKMVEFAEELGIKDNDLKVAIMSLEPVSEPANKTSNKPVARKPESKTCYVCNETIVGKAVMTKVNGKTLLAHENCVKVKGDPKPQETKATEKETPVTENKDKSLLTCSVCSTKLAGKSVKIVNGKKICSDCTSKQPEQATIEIPQVVDAEVVVEPEIKRFNTIMTKASVKIRDNTNQVIYILAPNDRGRKSFKITTVNKSEKVVNELTKKELVEFVMRLGIESEEAQKAINNVNAIREEARKEKEVAKKDDNVGFVGATTPDDEDPAF